MFQRFLFAPLTTLRAFLELIVMLVVALVALFFMPACGTINAFKAATSPSDYAFVIEEQYAALVHEAAALKVSGALKGSALAAVQAADLKAKPYVLKLSSLAIAYDAVKSADNTTALQAAVDAAVAVVADFTKTMKANAPPPTSSLQVRGKRLWALVFLARFDLGVV